MRAILSANDVCWARALATPNRAPRHHREDLTGTMCAVELTYDEVGATRDGDLPAGYRHVRRRADLGPASLLPVVAAGLRTWGIHRGAGLAVRANAEPT